MRITAILIICIFQFICTNAISSSLKQVTFDNDISLYGIRSIVKDDQGFMWFATETGVHRYDGYDLKTYQNNSSVPSSLSDNFVTTLYLDNDNNLLVGTSNGGLNIFDRKTELFTHYKNSELKSSITKGRINSIFQDKKDNIWVATTYGLSKFLSKSKKFERFSLNINSKSEDIYNNIKFIIDDRNEELWLSSKYGELVLFDQQSKNVTNYPLPQGEINITSDSDNSNSFFVQKNGNFLLAYSKGVYIFNPIKKQFIDFIDLSEVISTNQVISVKSLVQDDSGTIWIGTFDGLYRYTTEKELTRVNINSRLSSETELKNLISDLYVDNNSNLWVGSYTSGIYKLNIDNNKFKHQGHIKDNPNSISNNTVFGMSEDSKGKIWISTFGGGVNIYDPLKKSFSLLSDAPYSQQLKSTHILSIHHDKKRNTWIGTYGAGLSKLDGYTKKVSTFSHDPSNALSISYDSITSIMESKNSHLWLGTWGGG